MAFHYVWGDSTVAVEADHIAGKMKRKKIGYRSKGMHCAYNFEVVVAVPDAAVRLNVAMVVVKAKKDWSGIAVQPYPPKHLMAQQAIQRIEACREVAVK